MWLLLYIYIYTYILPWAWSVFLPYWLGLVCWYSAHHHIHVCVCVCVCVCMNLFSVHSFWDLFQLCSPASSRATSYDPSGLDFSYGFVLQWLISLTTKELIFSLDNIDNGTPPRICILKKAWKIITQKSKSIYVKFLSIVVVDTRIDPIIFSWAHSAQNKHYISHLSLYHTVALRPSSDQWDGSRHVGLQFLDGCFHKGKLALRSFLFFFVLSSSLAVMTAILGTTLDCESKGHRQRMIKQVSWKGLSSLGM